MPLDDAQIAHFDQLLRARRQALERIAAGDYGECLGCYGEIPTGRLEIDPAATLCVACAEKRNL